MIGLKIYLFGCIVSLVVTLFLARGYKIEGETELDDFPVALPTMVAFSWLNVFMILYKKVYRDVLLKGLREWKK